MRIVLCGSMSVIDQIEQLGASFEALGHEVVTPSRDERDTTWASLSATEQIEMKQELMEAYLDEIRSADAVVLANFNKNDVCGYVGANSLMEAAFAKALDVPIYLYQQPGPQPAQLELFAVQSACLEGNVRNVPMASAKLR